MRTKNYRCKNCGYYQDFQGTKEVMAKHFFEMNLEENQCPSCGEKEGLKEEKLKSKEM